MVLNLNVSIHLNILVLLLPLIYHNLLTSTLSALKLVQPLGPSIVTSIIIILLSSPHFVLLSCHSLLYILTLCPFVLCLCVCIHLDPPVSSINSEILRKTTTLCSKNWISHLFSQFLIIINNYVIYF